MKSLFKLYVSAPIQLIDPDTASAEPAYLDLTVESETTVEEQRESIQLLADLMLPLLPALLGGLGVKINMPSSSGDQARPAGDPPEPDQPAERWPGLVCDYTGTVASVRPGSPADASGILPGDRILAIDGVGYGPDAIGPCGHWSRAMDGAFPGDSLFVHVERPVAEYPAGFAVKTLVRPSRGPGSVS